MTFRYWLALWVLDLGFGSNSFTLEQQHTMHSVLVVPQGCRVGQGARVDGNCILSCHTAQSPARTQEDEGEGG